MDLIQSILEGDRRALARAMTLVERGDPASRVILRQVYPHTGRAHILGITGSPGTGKSTLVSALARCFRGRGRTVGIVAVDPSSPFSGGALLGDRIRMQELVGDPGIFIRSMASRGHLGGLAQATGDLVKLLDAAGFSLVVVETVGAGQAEVEVARAAHTVVVVEAPGLGDDIQAIKAGILEIAHILVVNKADLPGADRRVAQLEAMVAMGSTDAAWTPPVLRTIAYRGDGVEDLADAIEDHWAFLCSEGRLEAFRRRQAEHEFEEALRFEAMRMLRERVLDPERREELVERICRRELDPYSAAGKVLAAIRA
ncbi:MAG: methylmalonyl Co-A mutase-associated GTPase MeaB [Chloroflexia bacterium]